MKCYAMVLAASWVNVHSCINGTTSNDSIPTGEEVPHEHSKTRLFGDSLLCELHLLQAVHQLSVLPLLYVLFLLF